MRWLLHCPALKWFLLLVLSVCSLARAQSTIGVDPATRLFTATPGQSITQELSLYNPTPGTKRVRVVAYLTDMNISEIGETTYPAAGTLKESLSPWTTFSPSEMELGAQETKQIRYTIQVPAGAAPGTHWAMLMFEGQDMESTPGKKIAAFKLRVAHSIFVNVQPVKYSGEITGIFDTAPKKDTDFYSMAVQYSNKGNAATGVQGRVEVRDLKGDLVATMAFPLTISLPGRDLLLTARWAGPVPKGQYTALVILQDADRSRNLVSDHVIQLPFDLKEAVLVPPAPAAPAPVNAAPGTAAPANGTPAAPGASGTPGGKP